MLGSSMNSNEGCTIWLVTAGTFLNDESCSRSVLRRVGRTGVTASMFKPACVRVGVCALEELRSKSFRTSDDERSEHALLYMLASGEVDRTLNFGWPTHECPDIGLRRLGFAKSPQLNVERAGETGRLATPPQSDMKLKAFDGVACLALGNERVFRQPSEPCTEVDAMLVNDIWKEYIYVCARICAHTLSVAYHLGTLN